MTKLRKGILGIWKADLEDCVMFSCTVKEISLLWSIHPVCYITCAFSTINDDIDGYVEQDVEIPQTNTKMFTRMAMLGFSEDSNSSRLLNHLKSHKIQNFQKIQISVYGFLHWKEI